MATGKQKIDPELKRKWVEALRSGKYPQGYTRLKTGDGRYCCLGLLTELIPMFELKQHGKSKLERYRSDYAVEYKGQFHYGTPHYLVAENVLSYRTMIKLMELNDGEPSFVLLTREDSPGKNSLSFAQIADWIENNL